eukprot:scaffold117873_cov30-Tisochrysis_lutea.AAC.2
MLTSSLGGKPEDVNVSYKDTFAQRHNLHALLLLLLVPLLEAKQKPCFSTASASALRVYVNEALHLHLERVVANHEVRRLVFEGAG